MKLRQRASIPREIKVEEEEEKDSGVVLFDRRDSTTQKDII